MCRSKSEGGRRCRGWEAWCVNTEAHPSFHADDVVERHWHKPTPLLSMRAGAIRMRRSRAMAYACEVDAIRVVKGVPAGAPIGRVLREELWGARYQGAGLSLIALAERFEALALQEGVPVEEIARRYEQQQVRPSRQRAGERLADLVMERPDWVRPEHLVAAIEPPENGTPSQAYLRIVADADGREWVLVTSFDGSEPMVWPRTDAGLKAGAQECLDRVRAVNADPTAYEEWLCTGDTSESSPSPWTQDMTDADFLAHSGEGGMHLV